MYQQTIPVAASSISGRNEFIRKTYFHIFFTLVSFITLEFILFRNGVASIVSTIAVSTNWILMFISIFLVSWIATLFAHNSSSKILHYCGLSFFIVINALIFIPVLYFAEIKTGGGVIQSAAVAAILGFGSLTVLAFSKGIDLSPLEKSFLMGIIGIVSFLLCSVMFGFSLGVALSVMVVIFASGAVLFNSSSIIYYYGEDDYVAATIHLFSSIMLVLWYILRYLRSKELKDAM